MISIKQILKVFPWILLIVIVFTLFLTNHWPFSDQKEYQHVIDSSVILHEVENLGKLELVKYNFKEIFEYRRLSDGRIIENAILNTANYNPDLSVVLVASGEAVGCIDLTKLEVNHLKIDSDTIVISLPTPELCYHKLDLENTRIISYSKESWWSRIFSDESEKNEILHLAYQKAEKRLEEAAIESGIYASANKNIEIILKPFIERLTGKNVRIVSSLPNLDVSSNR